NDPASHPDSIGIPEGHPKLYSFMGVPLKQGGKTFGMIALANKESDYDLTDQKVIESLSVAFVESLNNKRTEEELQLQRDLLKVYSEDLEKIVEQRTRELREAQEELVRKEKLAVLGQLAGGVGHELRNPLGSIKNAVYYLNMVLEESKPEVRESLEIMEKEIETSERIINSLLDFSRPTPLALRKVDINSIVQKELSRIAIPKNVAVDIDLDESLPFILADPDQIFQVFRNIIINAIQAMPEGGQLTISSDNHHLGWVTISFTDTGEGIQAANLKKLFEPLFTTKIKGIGLGLAISKTLVEKHGGSIIASSNLGKGSTFIVKLPIRPKTGN
ncbi:MAG: ATP-binding protein, partial [Candidatus Hodarchaeales archaeon]